MSSGNISHPETVRTYCPATSPTPRESEALGGFSNENYGFPGSFVDIVAMANGSSENQNVTQQSEENDNFEFVSVDLNPFDPEIDVSNPLNPFEVHQNEAFNDLFKE